MQRVPSTTASTFRRAATPEPPPSIRIRSDEFRTVREAMREFGSLLTGLEQGRVEKLVLTQRNRMRAVVVSVERWSEMEQVLAEAPSVSRIHAAQENEPADSPGRLP